MNAVPKPRARAPYPKPRYESRRASSSDCEYNRFEKNILENIRMIVSLPMFFICLHFLQLLENFYRRRPLELLPRSLLPDLLPEDGGGLLLRGDEEGGGE
jgi:hypothetical protein